MPRYTLYLLSDISVPSDTLEIGQTPDDYVVSLPDGHALDEGTSPTESGDVLAPMSDYDGVLFFSSTARGAPAWANWVDDIVEEDLPKVSGAAASGLWVFKGAGRWWGMTFGYGRTFLDFSKVVRGFGIRTTLGFVDPDDLRAMAVKRVGGVVRQTSQQTSRGTSLQDFDIERALDIVRSASGRAADSKIGKNFSGSDALVFNSKLTLDQIPAACGDILEKYETEAYRTHFPWIDQIIPITDSDVICHLEALLLQAVVTLDETSVQLALPEVIEWDEVSAFKIAGAGSHEFDDLSLVDYAGAVGPNWPELTIEVLKKRKVSVVYSRQDWADDRWTVFRCLVADFEHENDRYVLSEGQWYRVDQDLCAKAEAYLAAHTVEVALLPAPLHAEKEGDYNKRAEESQPGSLLCLDQKIVQAAGAKSGFESCDLLTKDRRLVHVKKKDSSSKLSHLFAQGSVSAITLLSDSAARDRIRSRIQEVLDDDPAHGVEWLEVLPGSEAALNGTELTVTYAVMTKKSMDNALPFFSMLNFMHHGTSLENRSVTVEICFCCP